MVTMRSIGYKWDERKRKREEKKNHLQRVPRRDEVFPQAVLRGGADNFALYERGSGKRDRHIPGDIRKNVQVGLPLTWSILAHEYLTVTNSQEGGDVMWLGLALSYFLLCRASELFAYANGLGHPNFCLTRDCLALFRGVVQVNIEDRARADSVKVLLVASKTDQNREGCTTTRVRMAEGAGVGKTPVGAFEALVELLDAHPGRPGGAPLTTRRTASGWKVITRTEAVVALRIMAASAGKNPAHFALHSGRIGEATKLAAQEMSELQIQRADRWKSRAFMVYVRDAGEGAQKVPATLTRER